MNIILLSTHLNTGGITSYLFTLTKGLLRRGHRVHVASSGGNMESGFLSVGAKLLTIDIRTKSELDPRIYQALLPLRKYILDNGIQCVHCHTRVTQVMGALLKRWVGRPYIATCHGFFKTRFSRKLFPCWGDKVIAISKAVQDHLVDDFRVSPDRVVLVENGVDLEEFMPADHETKARRRKQYNLGDEAVIGMVARLSDVKGQDILIEAMSLVTAEMPAAKLLLVGEGKMENLLRAMVKRLGLDGQVRFIPLANRTNEILSLFDIFVMPSRQEGLGLSIMEAQAAGVPVVASRVGGIPTLIEDGKTGILVEPGNPRLLSKAITGLLGERGRCVEIGRSGREFIKSTFSADKMVEKTLGVYQQMIAN